MDGSDKHTANQRIVARAVILGAGGCLVLQKSRPDRDEYFGLPGGAKETFETLIEALQREAREEIGSSLLNPELIAVADYRRREESGAICDITECLFVAGLPERYEPANGPRPDRNQNGVTWLELNRVVTAAFSPPYLRDVILRVAGGERSLGYLGAFADTRIGHTTAG